MIRIFFPLTPSHDHKMETEVFTVKKSHHTQNKSIEVLVFGFLATLQAVYIAWEIISYGWKDFFRYWSCWNYMIVLAYYVLVIAARSGRLRTAMLVFTPLMFGLTFLWAVLSLLIAVLGADAIQPTVTSTGTEYTLTDIERLAGLAYQHFAPVIVIGIYALCIRRQLRHAYRRSLVLSLKPCSSYAIIAAVAIAFWSPWLLFVIYTYLQDPYDVYGFEKPSTAVMLGIEGATAVAYFATMALAVVYLFGPEWKCCNKKTPKSEH